jgi:hypothetical protein
MSCPACSSENHCETGTVGVFECGNCKAIHGRCYRGEGYKFYTPQWHEGSDGETFYLDLELLGSDGLKRFHGWIDRQTKKIVQVG